MQSRHVPVAVPSDTGDPDPDPLTVNPPGSTFDGAGAGEPKSHRSAESRSRRRLRAGQHVSFVSSKVESRPVDDRGHRGLFCVEPIRAGELLVVWGGEILGPDDFARLSSRRRQHSLQVDEDLYLVPFGGYDPGAWVNHSCEPNAGLNGQITLRAMRDIERGEEIRYDYAMSDGSPYDEFACGCGTPSCRRRVSGDDWRLPLLQHLYRGWFSPYLQRRIDLSRSPAIPGVPATTFTEPASMANLERAR